MHSRLEEKGKRHECKFNYVTNRCECKCWHTKHYISEEAGFDPTAFANKRFSWKNLVFHEAATGSKTDPKWHLIKGDVHKTVEGYEVQDPYKQHYWNIRNTNRH